MDYVLIGADSFSWFAPASWLAILKVVAGLGAVIFVHELGHFLVAKACGVKCEKFYLGFDAFDIRIGDFVLIPRRLFHFQWGETEYGIGIIPLGGYVKMLGQDDNPANAAAERERSMRLKEEAAANDEAGTSEGGSSTQDAAATTELEDDQSFELDPRSYQAKSVPQRMAIISAGVIMNLIFAVIFASIAYMVGAPYEPCIIGNVVPGGPAWIEDVQIGDEVVQIGKNGDRREHLRFTRDLQSAIAYNGDKQDMVLYFKSPETGEEREISMRPRTDLLEFKGAVLPQLGIRGTTSLILRENPVLPEHSAGKAGFKANDKIVALTVDDRTWEDATFATLKHVLALHSDKTVIFRVERSNGEGESKETLNLTVDPNPMRNAGLIMEVGPIYAVQEGSPASKAGIHAGDEILSIDDEPIGDPFALSDRMRTAAEEGRSIVMEIKRTDEKGSTSELTMSVDPRLPRTRYSTFDRLPIAIDELGICFKVRNVIAEIVPGSTAESEGLQPGDEVVSFKFVPANDERKQIEADLQFTHDDVDISDIEDVWPVVHEDMQQRLLDTKLEVTVKRGEKDHTASLQLSETEGVFQRSRGMYLTPLELTHKASSFGEAVSLGFRETKEDAFLVFSFLKKLFTNEISPFNLGGPGTIAVSATHEAMYGTARLLLFLTLLSANLAVVNFLPIPVLDGGHMVFLTWEAIFRKPLSEKVMVTLSMAGLLFIVGLMLFVISLDVWRFLPG